MTKEEFIKSFTISILTLSDEKFNELVDRIDFVHDIKTARMEEANSMEFLESIKTILGEDDGIKNLIEWYAFDEETTIEWAEQFIKGLFVHIIDYPVHKGDCTNEPEACILCILEGLLHDYYNYAKPKLKK